MDGFTRINDGWLEGHEFGVNDTVQLYSEIFDRFTNAVGSKEYATLVLTKNFEWLEDADWKKRVAAVYTLFLAAEGCRRFFKPRLEEIIDKTTSACVSFPHFRVRWILLHLYGGFATDIGHSFVCRFGPKIYPVVLNMVEDENSRVVAHAALALINIFEATKRKDIKSFVPLISGKLLVLIQNPDVHIRGNAITALAAFSDLLKTDFREIYPVFDPVMKTLWHHSGESDETRGKILETITLIGMNVGKELFGADGINLCNYLLSPEFQSSSLASEPIIINCWGRLARVLEDDFVPFLPRVLPLLFAHIDGLESSVSIADADETIDDDKESIKVGHYSLSLSRGKIDNASSTIDILSCIVSSLKSNLAPFCTSIYERAISGIRFICSTDVQLSGLQLIEGIFEVVHETSPQATLDLWQTLEPNLPSLFDALDIEGYGVFFSTLGAIIPKVTGISYSSIKTIHHNVVQTLQLVMNRKHEAADGDEEEGGETEADFRLNDEILTSLFDTTTRCFEKYPEEYFVLFSEDIEQAAEELIDSSNEEDRLSGICFFHDIFQYCPHVAPKYVARYMPMLLQDAVNQENPELRQGALSAIGWCCLNGDEAVKPFLQKIAQVCREVITAPESRTNPENLPATENAVGAFSKLLLRWHTFVPEAGLKGFVQFFLQSLPVSKDVAEAYRTYNTLLTLCTKLPQIFLGDNRKNAGPLAALFSYIESLPLANDALRDRIAEVRTLLSLADS